MLITLLQKVFFYFYWWDFQKFKLEPHKLDYETYIVQKVYFRHVGQILMKVYYFGVYYFRNRLYDIPVD